MKRPRMAERTYRFHGHTPPKAGQRTPILAARPTPDVDDNGVATLRLYDPIDSWGEFWGVSAKEFVDALDQVGDVAEIRLHINCPGGEVFEGIAILNALRNHKAMIVAIVDGLAASAASFIACGADELVMGRNSELMIHDAWGVCVGPAEDMRDLANRLDQHSDNIASIYAEKAGGTVPEWREAMRGESWYSASEAVASGLADRVDTTADEARNDFDLSVFTYPGRAAAPAPGAPSASAITAPPVAPGAPPAVTGDTTPTIDVDRLSVLLTTTPHMGGTAR